MMAAADGDGFKWVRKKPYFSFNAVRARDRAERVAAFQRGIELLPGHWRRWVDSEYARRGGVDDAAAAAWFDGVAGGAGGRVPLSASDGDLRAAADSAAADCRALAQFGAARGADAVAGMLFRQAARWGVSPPVVRGGHSVEVGQSGLCVTSNRELRIYFGSAGHFPQNHEISITDNHRFMPAIRRLCCARWWLRALRRAHGRRCDGAAIRAGVVRRGLWPYASEDAVERRGEQRRRNQRAIDGAVVACEASGEAVPLADVVAGSVANPEVKRSELMVRIKGCDAVASDSGFVCEFWTLTAPSRFHSQRHVTKKRVVANPIYDGSTPKEAQQYLSRVWARARAAWKRRGLDVYGLRTAEPHHDACPHWHLICYGSARDVRFARRLLRVYALRDSPFEAGARKHRFVVLKAKKGRYGAAYAAKYISKNINGVGMGGAGDGEAGRKVADSVRRVDAWAAVWGIRQFQFFGCPQISIWRALRRLRGPVAVAGSMLERARSAADDADFSGFWYAAQRGGLALIYRAADRLTAYGDAAAARIVGVAEGARRAFLPVKDWVIHWRGGTSSGDGVGVAFDLPRSCVNNCTGAAVDRFEDAAAAVFSVA